ncbi:MAG: hypothetical protein ACI4VC_01120 [Clostridia bacterium]
MNIYNIAERILKKIPEGLSDLEKARFVYLELGKMVSFNEEYWFGNSKIKNKIYKSQTKIEDLKDIKNNKIICVSLSNLYNYMMGRIGIKAVQAHDVNDSRHVYSEFEIDGKRYKADLQKDLHFIQTKRRTWEFGEIDVSVADSEVNTEEIEKIDAKIGYSYQGEKNFRRLIANIENEIKKVDELDKKMNIILNKISEYEDISKMGYSEKIWYYYYIIKRMLTLQEKKRECENQLYTEDNDKRKYTCCISVLKRDGEFYRMIYSEKNGKFIPVEDEILIELIEDGLKTCRNEKIPGLKKKMKELNNKNNVKNNEFSR